MTALHLGCLYNNTDITKLLLSDKRVDATLKFSGKEYAYIKKLG